MRRLVALVQPPGPRFVEALQRAWDHGDAVLPVDTRLPDHLVAQLLDEIGAHVVVDASGDHSTRHATGGHGEPRPVEDGDALVVATSGTTGAPKGVVLTHDAVRASALATSARLGIDPERHRWLCCLPVAHVGGLSVITRSLHTGTPVEVHPGFDAAAVTDAATRGATHTSLVTAALVRIDPSVFERILLGGAAPPAEVPANCTLTYGMTETGSGIWYDDAPLDGVEVDVRDGEIFVRGPMLLRAYRRCGADVDPKSPDGWLATGDGGERTAGGGLVVHGRRSTVIVTGGEKVWPETVERVLADHPGVADVLVRGEPHPEWGHQVVACVVPADASAPPTLEALRDFCRDALPPYALPRSLDLVDALARTALGKLRRG
jgi:O-succinylbenzoic acid--CoA ligase